MFEIERQEVLDSGHPIHSLTWILNSWSQGLTDQTKENFFNMRVGELVGSPQDYFSEPFVSEISEQKKFELGATTAMWAKRSLESVPLNIGDISPHHNPVFSRQEYKHTWEKLSLSFE